jgi:hypothetical protein
MELYDPQVGHLLFHLPTTISSHTLSQEKVGLCFIELWAASESMLSNFKVPYLRGRVGSEYKIKRFVAAFEEGGKAEIYLQIDQCMRKRVQQCFEQLGAGQVVIHSFARNDNRYRIASRFLDRVVHVTSRKPGMTLYIRDGWLTVEELRFVP